jgi:threonine dehydrogenase-like Zn-dependent dehydrogenase
MISCTSPLRAAYGWQRDGGMAPYLLAEEKDCVLLPDSLTYTDGAQIACGFGTVYEGLEKIGICGNDAVLVVGLGPVGLVALMLAKAMGAQKLIGVDVTEERCRIAQEKKLADNVFVSGPNTLKKIVAITNGNGVERAVDCSGDTMGRQLSINTLSRENLPGLKMEQSDVSSMHVRGWPNIEGSIVTSGLTKSVSSRIRDLYAPWLSALSKISCPAGGFREVSLGFVVTNVARNIFWRRFDMASSRRPTFRGRGRITFCWLPEPPGS